MLRVNGFDTLLFLGPEPEAVLARANEHAALDWGHGAKASPTACRPRTGGAR